MSASTIKTASQQELLGRSCSCGSCGTISCHLHVATENGLCCSSKSVVIRHCSPRLQSRIGRDKQRYDGKYRLLSCVVCIRINTNILQHYTMHPSFGYEILLVTSSRHPKEWILPKGGIETDESIQECAIREVEEEAGVTGTIQHTLGTLDFISRQKKPCRMYAFSMEVTEVFQQWPESNVRTRKWVSLNESIEMLSHRPEMIEIVQRAIACITIE